MADTQTKIPKERPRKITVGVRLSDEEFKQLEEKSHGTTVANFYELSVLVIRPSRCVVENRPRKPIQISCVFSVG